MNMNISTKRILTLILAVALIVCMMPAYAFAADDPEPSHDVYWKYSPTEKALIIGTQEGVTNYQAADCTETGLFTEEAQIKLNEEMTVTILNCTLESGHAKNKFSTKKNGCTLY